MMQTMGGWSNQMLNILTMNGHFKSFSTSLWKTSLKIRYIVNIP